MRRIGILELGAGGTAAIARAVESVAGSPDASVKMIVDASGILGCGVVILPAAGSFGALASRCDDTLREALRTHVAGGNLLLGIGAGMHLLFDRSAEAPGAAGLSLLSGSCEPLASSMEPMTRDKTRVPHMGWNRLVIELAVRTNGMPLPQGAWVYFAHRFHALPADPAYVAATVEYGHDRVAAVVARDGVVGMQFRPERSGAVGLRILHALLSRWA